MMHVAYLLLFPCSYVCVPDGRSNILPMERFVLHTAKAVCTDDYSAAVTHTRELVSLVGTLGLQRSFNVPFLLELVAQQLFAALKLANDAINRPRTDPTEAFVVHERVEISGTR